MSAKILLRTLIVSEVALLVAGGLVHFATMASLPNHLRQYFDEQAHVEWTIVDWVGCAVNAGIGVSRLIAWIGLWRLWQPARLLYVAATAASLLILPFMGPNVCSALVNTLLTANVFCSGLIVGVVFFSDVRLNFGRATSPPTPS